MDVIRLIFDPNTADLIETQITETVLWLGRAVTWVVEGISAAFQKVVDCFADFILSLYFLAGGMTLSNINLRDRNEMTPLVNACIENSLYKVRWLLARGASVNQRDIRNETPLSVALFWKENLEMAKTLLAKGAHATEKAYLSANGGSILHYACSRGRRDFVEEICKYPLNVDVENDVGETPLFIACKEGNFEMARALLAKGANINKKNNQGFTVLHKASQDGIYAKVEQIIELGAQVDIEDAKGETPLFLACKNKHHGITRLLLAKGADINKKNSQGVPRLHRACQDGDFDLVQMLVTRGATVDIGCEKEELTPLMLASNHGHISIVRYLLNQGADANKQCKIGDTALIVASYGGYLDIVRELLDRRVEINKTDNKGKSALMWAASRAQMETAQLLVSSGAEVNKQDNSGYTALMYACQNEDVQSANQLAELLLSHRAEVNKQAQNGKTALTIAIFQDNTLLAKRLLAEGAKESQLLRVFKSGMTPLHKLFENPLILGIKRLQDLFLSFSLSFDVTCRNEENETPLASILTREADDGAKIRERLIQNLFPEFGVLKEVLKRNDVENFLDYFKEFPDKLISHPKNYESANPFRLALLFGDKKLCHLLAANMTPELFLYHANELEKAYPKVPVAEFLYNSILKTKTPIPGYYAALKEHFGNKVDMAKKNDNSETFFKGLLSLPASDQHYAQAVIREFFGGFREIRDWIAKSKIGFIEYFIKHHQKLITHPKNEPNVNPLEVAFLFGSISLAKSIAKKLTPDEFQAFGIELKKSFPKSDVEPFLFHVEYELNYGHLGKILSGKIPPKPEKSKLEDFLRLFDTINFSDPKAPFYVDPEKVLGKNQTQDTLRKVVEDFIEKIKARKGINGDHPEGTPARAEFYSTLENGICGMAHFLLAESKSDSSEQKKIKTMCEIIKDIAYCGPKVRTTVVREFNSVVRNYAPTFDNLLFSKLTNYRSVIFEGIIPQNEQNTHDFILAVKRWGNYLGLAESQDLSGFDDVYSQSGDGINVEKIRNAFVEIYAPHAIVNMVTNELTSDDEFREKYATWWQDNAPSSWQGSLSPVFQKVKKLGSKKSQIISYLKSKDIDVEKNDDPHQVLEAMRKQNFVLEEVYENVGQNRFKSDYIIKSLEKQGVILRATTFH